MSNHRRLTLNSFIAVSAIILILFRIVLMVMIPLMDKTEARYAEIARLMVETNEWVVLTIDHNVWFWAKPPLSTWITAGSFQLFGISEWVARLPSLVLSLLVMAILYWSIRKVSASLYVVAFILITMPQFLLHTGVVSTDTTFSFCVMMVMLCYWNTQFKQKHLLWGYGFFVFMGLGLLAKGPVILALTLPPLVCWSWFQKNRSRVIFWQLPWFSGSLLTVAIALPWYLLAEQQTPGFLNYFILGEHLGRFLQPSWQGDLYGFAKAAPKGTIWLFLLAGAFPWIQLVLYWLWKNKRVLKHSSWILYLTFWMLWTPIFFTFSSNISHTYIIPALAPIAILSYFAWKSLRIKRGFVLVSLLLPTVALVLFLTAYLPGKLNYYINSDKYLINLTQPSYSMLTDTTTVGAVYFFGKKTYSAQFYSQGRIKEVPSMKALNKITQSGKFYLIVPNQQVKEIREHFLLKTVGTNHRHTLLKYQPANL